MNRNDNHTDVDKAIERGLNSDVPPDVEDRLRGRLADFRRKMDAAGETAAVTARPASIAWKRTLSFAVPAVAVILMAAVISLTLFGGNGSNAYAQVVERLRQARTMVYRGFLQAPNIPDVEINVFYKEPGRARQELSAGAVTIYDFAAKRGMALMTEKKQYLVIEFENLDNPTEIDIIKHLRSLPERATEQLGEREIDGRTVEGFKVVERGAHMTVWVDAGTGDLVRIDATFPDIEGMEILMTDFRFDVELSDDLFSMEPPEGYEEFAAPLQVTEASEDHLLYLLEQYALRDPETRFPETIGVGLVASVFNKGEDSRPEDRASTMTEEERMQRGVKVGLGIRFVMEMKPENDWHYFGTQVKFGEAEKPVAWYRPAGSDAYRVIMGDLSVLEVEVDDLPATPVATTTP